VSRPTPELTTTSYGILGLLAIRPWSGYELTQRFDRGLGRFWPRAESKLFEEPKKLAAHGLSKATKERVGKRPRTVYSITAKGRRALARWLSEPGAPPAIESEQLLKVFFAEHGTKDDLVSTLADIGRWADGWLEEGAEVAQIYLDGQGPFQHRAAQLTLAGEFLFRFAEMVEAWAAWATDVVEGWPDEPGRAEPDLSVFERHVRRGRRQSRASRTTPRTSVP
jgi:DNA-binding PadR family transcriptional regulator